MRSPLVTEFHGSMFGYAGEEDEGSALREGVVGGDEHLRPRRNLRARLTALQRARTQGLDGHVVGEVESDSSEDDDDPEHSMEDGEGEKEGKKIGTKKLKRIQEKAERKAVREVRFSKG